MAYIDPLSSRYLGYETATRLNIIDYGMVVSINDDNTVNISVEGYNIQNNIILLERVPVKYGYIPKVGDYVSFTWEGNRPIVTGAILGINSDIVGYSTAINSSSQVASDTIGEDQIKDGSIDSIHIKDAAIDTAHIKDAAIDTAKIKDLAVTTAKIANAAITTAKIEDLAVTEAKIEDAAITTAKIADLAVTQAKIADASISTAKIQDMAVDNAKIANAAIDTAKIRDLAVTDAKIANISAEKITTGNISADRMKANVIEAINLSTSTAVINQAKIGELDASKITSGNIATERLRANIIEAINTAIGDAKIDGARIKEATITDAHIVDLSAEKITTGSLSANVMQAQVIDAINISSSSVVIDQAKIGNIDASKITSGDIDTERLKANVIDAINLSTTTARISQAKIEDLDASKIVSGIISTDILKANVIDAINLSASNAFIDGAKIRDASIDNAKISYIDASKITTGDISADRMRANVIEAINLSASGAVIDSAKIGSIDASKITSGTIDTSKVTISTSATGQGARIDIINDGIYLIDSNNNTIARFATNQGLIVHSPAGIKLDNNGSIKLGPTEDVVIDSYGLKAKAGGDNYTAFFSGEGIKVIDPIDSNKQIIINSGQVKLTTDGGQTFRAALTPEGLYGNVLLDGTLPATKFDTTPPAVPTWREEGVSSIVEQTPETQIVSIVVKWNEVADSDLEGYRIYLAEGSSEDYFPIATVGKTNFYKIIGVKPNTTYKIKVTSFDKQGNECPTSLPPSQQYTTYPKTIVTAKDIIPPATPTSAPKVVQGFKLFMLSWEQVTKNSDGSNCYDLDYYEIQRSSSVDWNNWTTIAQIKGTSFIDKDVEYNIEYKYRIRAVDTSGNVSGWSPVAYAGIPLQVGGADIVAHSITTEHIATSGLSADVITSGKIRGDLIEANTITADKFESKLYGDLTQALRYVESRLKEKVFEWLGTTENYQQGTFNGTYSVGNVLMLETVYHWDQSDVNWDSGFYWDKPVVTYGTWESPVFDLGSLVTILCMYQIAYSAPSGAEVKVYLKQSEDGISWTDYVEFVSEIITTRYIRIKIELATPSSEENIKITDFKLQCFVDTPEVIRIDFESHKNDFNNPHRVYHNQTMPLEVDETSTDSIKDKHISNLQAKRWEDHRLNTDLAAHGTTTNSTISVGGVNSSGNIVIGGQLGINTVPSGNYRLKIKESSSADGYGLQIENADASKSMQMWVGTGGAVIDAQGTTNLHLRTAGIDRLYIANGGNVGIGTTSPVSKLDISGGSLRLPSSGYEGAGQIQCAGTVRFANGSAAQEIYVKQISVTNSWADADTNKVTNGIYTKGGIKTAGQVVSTVTTGTAPFSITSTTLVSNLNVDLLDNYHASDLMNDAQARVDTHASSKQTHGISGSYYIAKTSRSDQLPDWADIQNKPISNVTDIDDAVNKRHIQNTDNTLINSSANTINTTGTGNIVDFKVNNTTKSSIDNNGNFTGNAATATKLQTARTISLSGDISGSTSFDGSANVTITATLANSGVTAGTYTKVTVDAKGRVTAGSNITSADVTDATSSNTANTIVKRDASGNFSAGTITATLNGNASTATKLQTARIISLTGDVSGSASFDGSADASISVTLANTGVTAGTYRQVTVDAKGRVTAGSNPTTLAGYGITDAVRNAGNTPSIQAGLDANKPTAGTAGRLYIATDTRTIYRDDGSAWQTIASASGTASKLESTGANIVNTTGTGNIVDFQVSGVTRASVDNTGKFTGTIDWNNVSNKPTSYTPSAHKSTHASGGSDPLTPADIGAVNKAGDTMTGDLFNSGAFVVGSNSRRTSGSCVELYGPTSSAILSVQDGTGRIQMKWNATRGTPETFLVGGEHAARWLFTTTSPDNQLLYIDFADGTNATAGQIISWTNILQLGRTTFSYLGNKVWHAGNDGSGSGLDADLLDGTQLDDIMCQVWMGVGL